MGTKLYVGNLPYNTSDQDLMDLFGAYSPVSASIITDRATGRSKGFGFVEFNEENTAQKAADELNGSSVDGRSIVVNIARPKEEDNVQPGDKLYVGNLSYDLDDHGLADLFSKYGSVVKAEVIKFSDTQKSKGFGFVQFSSIEEATAALEMNGHEMDGRNLIVKMARPKEMTPRY